MDILTGPGLGRACPQLWKTDLTTGTKPLGEQDYAPNPCFFSPYLPRCAGFGWGRVNFLHSSWYGAVVWICAGNSVDNTGMFSLLLSSAYTEPRPFLLLTHPTSEQAGGAQGVWRGHSRDS